MPSQKLGGSRRGFCSEVGCSSYTDRRGIGLERGDGGRSTDETPLGGLWRGQGHGICTSAIGLVLPVHRYVAAKRKPLQTLRRVAEYGTRALKR